MGSRACAAVIAFLLATPNEVWAASAHRRAHTSTHTATKAAARSAAKSKRPAVRKPRLEQAKAAMAALIRDRDRRRYRHNWEKAIAGLLQAARGRDRAAALSEAARARYALYRWSADEADRVKALRLAEQAARLGAGDARALAAAIRREAGDDRPAPAPARKRTGARVVAATPPPPPPEEDEPSDPALDHVETALAAADGGAPAGEGTEGPARISEIRAWSSPDYTRVAIYLSHWVKWQQLEIPAAAGKQRRLAIDLGPAVLEGRTHEQAVGGGRLSRVRAAQHDAGSVRVVLDLDGDDRVQVFRLEDPPRLVLDLAAPVAPAQPVAATPALPSTPPEQPGSPEAAPSPGAEPATESAPDGLDTVVELPPRARALLEGATPADPVEPPAAAAPAAAAVLRPPLAPADAEGEEGDRVIRRIVVDAGHGGHDPGAIGPSRVREKDVTLSIARRLAKKLRASGFEVVLTRSGDRYLALEERTAIANAARADLFVSVHANAHPRRVRSGVETYYLNVTDDRYARRLAARENGADLSVAGDLARILTDLDAKASADASLRLARLVQREVCGGVRSRVGDVHDLGVKSALFYVLLGARMPAVLVETGFISNRVEEKRLASAYYQEEVANGIVRAVERFARGEPAVARR
jgi:N-acetylmuramoyl-L-alanine amidase